MPILILFLALGTLLAQPPTQKLMEEGQAQFARRCTVCHGADAEGSTEGPALAGNRRLRTRSAAQVRGIISNGIPSTGMPAFHLPAPELDALTAWVHSLNSAASESFAPGNAAFGQQFFFGKGQCGDCHMINGKGSAIGPDLSDIARELTMSELRQSLVHPGERMTPGYDLVNVRLRDGSNVRGFARGRTNFDIQLQDLKGRFHLLPEDRIAEIREEKQSIMKPLAASAEERRDLIAYLCTLTGVKPGVHAADQATPATESHPGDWTTYNGNVSGNRYSELSQIGTANVSKLGLKWAFPIDHYGLETTPLVTDGVMYVTGPNQAYALDAVTGRQIWKYSRPRTTGLVGDASLGTNRGVALLGDKVFMVTDNAHLIALNRITGALVWDMVMPESPQHYGSTVAPLIVKDTVIAGVSGGDWGIRGFVACFKASTGEMLWRHWTIPLKGEPGSETWKGTEPLFGGGSTWLTGAYDPGADTLYWPTGNPWPDSNDRDRPGDNLYTNCILALNPATGALKWHFQFTPHDVHDWDATEPPVLVDTQFRGQPRKLLLHADRNGFYYVLDRIEGQVLLATQFAHRQTWAGGIGPDGRPLPLPKEADDEPMCPGSAANWNSAAFSPTTRLFYVLALEQCKPGKHQRKASHAEEEPERRYVRALDFETGKTRWEIPLVGPALAKTWPGLLATAGGVLFYGDPNGAFAAADQGSGKTLWHFPTNVPMKASPMTYTAGGRQFVAVAAGPNILSFGLPEDIRP